MLFLAHSNFFWLILAIFGQLLPFLAKPGKFLLFLANSCYFWLVLAISHRSHQHIIRTSETQRCWPAGPIRYPPSLQIQFIYKVCTATSAEDKGWAASQDMWHTGTWLSLAPMGEVQGIMIGAFGEGRSIFTPSSITLRSPGPMGEPLHA